MVYELLEGGTDVPKRRAGDGPYFNVCLKLVNLLGFVNESSLVTV